MTKLESKIDKLQDSLFSIQNKLIKSDGVLIGLHVIEQDIVHRLQREREAIRDYIQSISALCKDLNEVLSEQK